MTREQLLDYNEYLVQQYIDLDGHDVERSEELRELIATTEMMLLESKDEPQRPGSGPN